MKLKKHPARHRVFVIASTCILTAPLAVAAPIGNACNRSERSSGAQLCHCIQHVANQILTNSEQYRAADFFEEPQMAQEARVSKDATDIAFWSRYKLFASTAEDYCG